MAVITVPKVLREKLGEDGTDTLVELINLANQKVKEDVIELSAEKFERRLTEEMAKVNQRITDEVANLRGEMAKLDNKISEAKADLMKWMFIFIFGQYWLIVGTLTAILFAFFKR
jgi:hypothetical protein